MAFKPSSSVHSTLALDRGLESGAERDSRFDDDSSLVAEDNADPSPSSGTILGLVSDARSTEPENETRAAPDDESSNNQKLYPAPCPRPHRWIWHWILIFFGFILHKMRSLTRRWLIGVGILLLVNFIWAASSVIVQAVFSGFDKPFFVTFFSTSLFTLFLFGFVFLKSWRENDRVAEEMACGPSSRAVPHTPLLINDKITSYASESDQAVLDSETDESRYTSSVAALSCSESDYEARESLERRDLALEDSIELVGEEEEKEPVPIFPVKRVALLALQFLPIWFFANVTFYWSLQGTSVTSNSIISTTSSFWTLLFCHFFKVERFTILRSVALAVTLAGVIIVALSDKNTGKDSLIGDVLAVVSAICYGLYAAFLRIRIKDEKQVKMPMFFGFVGFFNMIFMWPFFFILHYTGVETFEVPSLYALLILTLNGLVGTVLSDLLWTLVIFLTSATVATVGLSLNVPFALVLDLIVKHRKFSGPYYAGALVVLIGFFVANLS